VTGEQRRLAAILVADVVGYSRAVGVDEAGTLAALAALRREVLEPALAVHGGRLFKAVGDGFLVEFASAVQAVNAALGIQKSNGNRSLMLRIGIHLGDVVVEGDDLMGDGVNVAARIEGVAEAGGIVISRAVHEQVRDRIDAAFEDRGEVALKNIARPVQVFAVGGAAKVEESTVALPDKPSIAVLPFQNMSADPEQEYFADGIVDDIITALSRAKGLFVIARNSSFTYKGRAVDVREVGRELGVRYVLEGSVRRAANRLRLTGQLVEAADGRHVWADRFEGALDDMFDLQDRITAGVILAMLPTLEQAEIERSRRKPTSSLTAYDYFLRGKAKYGKFDSDANDEAFVLFGKAAALDPEWSLPAAYRAECVKRRLDWGWTTDIAGSLTAAADLARRALAVDCGDPQALALAGSALTLTQPGEAAALLDRAIGLDPNHYSAWNWRGWAALVLGEKDAARYFESALRLSPVYPGRYWLQVGLAASRIVDGKYEEAADLVGRVLRQHPNLLVGLWVNAAALGLAGRVGEARKSCEALTVNAPAMRLSNVGNWVLTRNKDSLELITRGLRLAGLPE
jgi:adenylate cyclase